MDVSVKRATSSVFILAALMILSTVDAFACTCELPLRNLTLKQQVNEARKNSKAVFAGRVLEIIANAESAYIIVKFKIEESWKNVHAAWDQHMPENSEVR
jgi:hypothetical protein